VKRQLVARRSTLSSVTRPLVVIVVALVALVDIASGAWLLLSPAPWLAAGPDTVWTRAAAELGQSPALDTALASLWARVGAFSTFAGLSTLVWLWRGLDDRRTLSTLLVTYLVCGLAFAYSDAAFFEGTVYLAIKRAIGGAWVLAIVMHFWGFTRAAGSPGVPRARPHRGRRSPGVDET
jgi:hypothetical protein